MRIITKKELPSIVGLSAKQIARMEKTGAFPRRIQISPARVGWASTEVTAWIEAKLAKRDAEAMKNSDDSLPAKQQRA